MAIEPADPRPGGKHRLHLARPGFAALGADNQVVHRELTLPKLFGETEERPDGEGDRGECPPQLRLTGLDTPADLDFLFAREEPKLADLREVESDWIRWRTRSLGLLGFFGRRGLLSGGDFGSFRGLPDPRRLPRSPGPQGLLPLKGLAGFGRVGLRQLGKLPLPVRGRLQIRGALGTSTPCPTGLRFPFHVLLPALLSCRGAIRLPPGGGTWRGQPNTARAEPASREPASDAGSRGSTVVSAHPGGPSGGAGSCRGPPDGQAVTPAIRVGRAVPHRLPVPRASRTRHSLARGCP